MTIEEKRLYHQLHPIKLFVDISTAFGSTFLLWEQSLLGGLLLAFIPSMIISFAIIQHADLTPYKNSPAGRYMNNYLNSRIVDGSRFAGFFAMLIGGWYHDGRVIAAGLCLIAICWTYGFMKRSAGKFFTCM